MDDGCLTMANSDKSTKPKRKEVSKVADGPRESNGEDKQPQNEDGIEVIPPEILEQLPPHMRETISSIGIFSSPMQNPLARKITSEHIDKIIDNDDKDASRRFTQKTMSRFFSLAYVLIALGAFFLLSHLFGERNPDLFEKILVFFGTFFAGFGAGWGFTTFTSGQKN